MAKRKCSELRSLVTCAIGSSMCRIYSVAEKIFIFSIHFEFTWRRWWARCTMRRKVKCDYLILTHLATIRRTIDLIEMYLEHTRLTISMWPVTTLLTIIHSPSSTHSTHSLIAHVRCAESQHLYFECHKTHSSTQVHQPTTTYQWLKMLSGDPYNVAYFFSTILFCWAIIRVNIIIV